MHRCLKMDQNPQNPVLHASILLHDTLSALRGPKELRRDLEDYVTDSLVHGPFSPRWMLLSYWQRKEWDSELPPAAHLAPTFRSTLKSTSKGTENWLMLTVVHLLNTPSTFLQFILLPTPSAEVKDYLPLGSQGSSWRASHSRQRKAFETKTGHHCVL